LIWPILRAESNAIVTTPPLVNRGISVPWMSYGADNVILYCKLSFLPLQGSSAKQNLCEPEWDDGHAGTSMYVVYAQYHNFVDTVGFCLILNQVLASGDKVASALHRTVSTISLTLFYNLHLHQTSVRKPIWEDLVNEEYNKLHRPDA
jgi:hypothetical protein